MTRNVLLCGLLLFGGDPVRGAADESAADRITLRDGSVVLGQVTAATSGHRGAVGFLVRRDWAARNAGRHLAEWDRAAAAVARRAIDQRRERLATWRRERQQAPGVGPDDRILQWIDREQTRLADPDTAARTPLVAVRLPRDEVRALDRRPIAAGRLLRLAWLSGLRAPETMSVADLTGAMESRGLITGARDPGPAAALDRLLPPAAETEAVWLGRRAATEIAVDSGLRFLRYQGLVIADPGPGQQAPRLNPEMALSQLKRLLDPDADQARPDPLAEKLQAVAARGRIGAVVTGLTIAPDLGGVTVETTFWVRIPGGRWVAYGSRAATVRANDIEREAAGDLARDPQVKGVFAIVESLGFGSIAPELQQRSLRIGAATQRALGAARSDFNRDLDKLMLPVLELAPAHEPAGRAARPGSPAPDAQLAPRRSMLGPQNR